MLRCAHPQELDDAARRRLVKRIYIPLPDDAGRRAIVTKLLAGTSARMSGADVEKVGAGPGGRPDSRSRGGRGARFECVVLL